MAQWVTGYVMRPVEARDEQAVLTLVNADRVPGQPLVTSAMLAEALTGQLDAGAGATARLPISAPAAIAPDSHASTAVAVIVVAMHSVAAAAAGSSSPTAAAVGTATGPA